MNISKFNSAGYYDPTTYEALTNVAAEAKAARFRPLVYICSPYAGEVETNVENARRYSRHAVDTGYLPLAPHLLFPQFMKDEDPNERDTAMFMNIVLLGKCAELWVFGDVVSEGMRCEINRAKYKGKIIRYFKDDCTEVTDT